MTGKTAILSLTLLLSAVSAAHADDYDDCKNACLQTQTQCIEGITLYDPAGIEEAKKDCQNQMRVCKEQCMGIDAVGKEEYEKKQAESAEKKRQEQLEREKAESGGFQTYDPANDPRNKSLDAAPQSYGSDGGIKTFNFNE